MEGVPDPVGSSSRAEESTSHSAADSPAASSPKKRKKKRGVNKNSDCNSQSSKALSPEVTPKRGQKRKKTSTGDGVNSPKVTAFGDGSGSVWSQLGAFKCKTCGFTTTEENFFNCHTCSSKRSIASSPSSSCSHISSRSAHTQNAVPRSIAPRPGSMVVPVALPSPSAISSGSALMKTAVPSSAVPSPGLRVVLATASPHTAIDCSSALTDDAVPAVLDRRCSVPEEAASAVPIQGFIKHEMETGSFRCMQCNYRGKNKFFIEHLMYQMIINPYHCQHCPEKFADRSSFQKHCEQEHKGLKLECKLKRVSLVREVMNRAVKDGKEGKLTAFSFHPGFKACVKRSAKTGTPQPVPSSSQTAVAMPVTGFCSKPATTSTAAVSLASECAVSVTSSSAVSAPVLSAAVTTATSSAPRSAADNATVSVTASSATVSASTSPRPVAATAASSTTVSASTAPPFVTAAPALTTLGVTTSLATVSAPAISPFTAAAAALVTVGVTASSATVNAPVSSPSVTAASALATGGVIASSATVSAPAVSPPVTAAAALATVGVTASSATVNAPVSSPPVTAAVALATVGVTASSATVNAPVSSPPVTAAAALVTVGVTASSATVSAPMSSPPTAASLATVGAMSSSAVTAAKSLSTVNVMMSSSAVCATVSPSAVSATTSATVISTLLAPVSASRPSPPVGAASPVTSVSAASSSAAVGGATTVSAKTSTLVHATASSAAVSAASATVSVRTSSSAAVSAASATVSVRTSSSAAVSVRTSSSAAVSAASAAVSVRTSSSAAVSVRTSSSAAVSVRTSSSAAVSVRTSSSAIGIIGTASPLTTVSAKTSSAAASASASTVIDATASSATVSAKTSSVPSAASATISAATSPATVSTTTLSSASEMLPPSSTGTTTVPEPGQDETAASDTPLCSLSGSMVMQTVTENSSALAATSLDPAVTSHSQIINTSSSPTIQTEAFSESGSPLAKLAGETTLSQASESDKTAPAQNSDSVGNDHECLQADDDVASDNIVESCGEDLDVPVIIACQGNYIEHEGEEGVVSLSDEVSNREMVPFSSDQPTPVISSATVVSPVIVPGKTHADSFASLHACSASSVPTLIVPSQARPALVVTNQTKSLAAVTCRAGPDVVPVVPRQSCSVSTVPAPIVPSRALPALVVTNQTRPLALAAVTCQVGPNVAPVVPRQSGSVSFSTVHAPVVCNQTQSSQMGSSAAVSSLVSLNTVPVAHGSQPGSSLLSSCQFTSSATAPPLYMSVQTRQNLKNHLVQQRAVNANTQQNLFHQWRYRPARSVDSSRNVQWVFQDVASRTSNPPPSYSTPTGSQVSTQFSYSSPAVNLQNQFVPLNLVNSDRNQNTYHGQLAQQPSTPDPLPHGVILPSFISLPATSQVQPGTILRYMIPGTVGVAQRQSSTVQNTILAEGLQPALGPAHRVRKSGPQQELPERSVPQNVFPVYSPVSPASSASPVCTAVSPVYTPISPVYTPISPVYTPISPASPGVHARVYSPISPPASTSVQRAASPGTTSFPLDLSSPDHAYAALTVPAQNPDQGSTHARIDFVSAGSASTLSSCSTTVSVAATISASSTAGTSMVKQEKTVGSCRKSVSRESLSVSGDSFSVSAPATTTPPTSSTCNQADDSLCMGFIKRNNLYVCLLCPRKFLDSREFYLHVWKHQHAGGEKCSSCSSNPTPGTSTEICLKTTSVVENVSCNADARLLNYLRDDCREKLSRRLLHSDARGGPPVQSADAEAGEPASCALESADALLTHAEDTSALLSEGHLQKEADESLLRKANDGPLREVDEDPVKEAEEGQVRADGESPQEVSEDPRRETEEIEKDPLRDDAEESVKTDEDRQREAEDSLRETEEDPQREAEEPTIGADSSNKRGKGTQVPIPGNEINPDEHEARTSPTDQVNMMYDHSAFFICPFCNFSCDMAIDFTMHLNSDHPHEESYFCSHCHYRGQYTTDLTNHMTAHTAGDSKIYLCPCVKADGCGFQTGSLKDLDHHMKMHEKRTSYWCQKCTLEFPDEMAFLQHLRLNSMTLFTCSQCASRFLNKQAIQQHWQVKHSGGLVFRVLKTLLCLDRKHNGYHTPSQGLLGRRSSDELSGEVSGSEASCMGASAIPVLESPAPVSENLDLVPDKLVQVSESSASVSAIPVTVGIADSDPVGNSVCSKMPHTSASTSSCAADKPTKSGTAGGGVVNPYSISKEKVGVFRHLARQIKLPHSKSVSVEEDLLDMECIASPETNSVPEDSGHPSLEREGPSSAPDDKQELSCNAPKVENATRPDESHVDTDKQTTQPDHQLLSTNTNRVLRDGGSTPDAGIPSVAANSGSLPNEASVRIDEPAPAANAHIEGEDVDMDNHRVIQHHVHTVGEQAVARALPRMQSNCEDENLNVASPGATVSLDTEMFSQMPDEMDFIKLTDLFGGHELQEALLGNLYRVQSDAFYCCVCDKKFICPMKVHQHLFQHFNVPLFSCTLCQFSCSMKGDLLIHWQKTHPGKVKNVDNLLVKIELLQLLKQETPLMLETFREICREITEDAKKSGQSDAKNGQSLPSKPSVTSQDATYPQCSEGNISMAAPVTPAPNQAGYCGVKSSTRSMLSLGRRASTHHRPRTVEEQETETSVKHASSTAEVESSSSKKRRMSGESPSRPKAGTYRVVKTGAISKFKCNACGSMTLSPAGMATHLGSCTHYLNTQPVSKHTDVANRFAQKMRLSPSCSRAAGLLSISVSPKEIATVSESRVQTPSKSDDNLPQPSRLQTKNTRNLKTQQMSKLALSSKSWAQKMQMKQSSTRTPSSLCTDASSKDIVDLTASVQETFSESEESIQEPIQVKAKRRANQIVDSSSDEDGDSNGDVEFNRDESETGELEQIFMCKNCSFSASSTQKDELLAHVENAHAHLKKLLKCGHCDFLYGNEDRLRSHIKNDHPGKPELKEAVPLTSFYNAKEKENCSPKHRPVKQTMEAEQINIADGEPAQKRRNMAKQTGLRLGPSETESKVASSTAQVPAAERKKKSARQREDLPEQTAHSDIDARNNLSTARLESDEEVQEQSYEMKIMPVVRNSDAVQHPRKREGPCGLDYKGQSAAKQAMLTMQDQLQEDNGGSDDEEFDPSAHHQGLGKRSAVLDTGEFKNNRKSTPVPELSKLPAELALSQRSLGTLSQSAHDRLVPDHKSAVLAAIPASASGTSSRCKAGKQSTEADPISVALDTPAFSSQQRKNEKHTIAERSQASAPRTYGYICVMCNQYYMEQRGIMAHMTRHINYCTIRCGTCSMEFVTLGEARSHHNATHPGMSFNRMVCRDPQIDKRLSQLVAQCEAKAEKEKVPVVTKSHRAPLKDPETQPLCAKSVEFKLSIQCRQCQILLDSISMFKAHCEQEHGGEHKTMEWVDVESQGVYGLNGNLVQEGPGSGAIMHKYLCAFCPFRGALRETVAQHKEEVHTDVERNWIVTLDVTPTASSISSHQPRLADRNAAPVSAATMAAASPVSSTSTTTASHTPATQSSSWTAQDQQSSRRETGDDAASICIDVDSTGHCEGDLHSGGHDLQTIKGEEHSQTGEQGRPCPELADPKLRCRTSVRLKDFLNLGHSKQFKDLLLVNNISRFQLDPRVQLTDAALKMLLNMRS